MFTCDQFNFLLVEIGSCCVSISKSLIWSLFTLDLCMLCHHRLTTLFSVICLLGEAEEYGVGMIPTSTLVICKEELMQSQYLTRNFIVP